MVTRRGSVRKPDNQFFRLSLATYRAIAPRIDPAREGTMRLRRGKAVDPHEAALIRLQATSATVPTIYRERFHHRNAVSTIKRKY